MRVDAVPVAAGHEEFLRREGDDDRGRSRGQGASHGDAPHADGQLGRQGVVLHEGGHLRDARLLADDSQCALDVLIQVLASLPGHADDHDGAEHLLVGLLQLGAQVLGLGGGLLELVGDQVLAVALLLGLLLLGDRLHLKLGDLALDEGHAVGLVVGLQVQTHREIALDVGELGDEPVGQPHRVVADP